MAPTMAPMMTRKRAIEQRRSRILLFELPLEIRNMIYLEVLRPRKQGAKPKDTTALLRTSRQVYTEAHAILYTKRIYSTTHPAIGPCRIY